MTKSRQHTATARIVRDPRICGGEPTIRGTRVPVRSVAIQCNFSQDLESVRRAFPRLDVPAIQEALAFYEANREEIQRLIEENERIAYGAE